MSLIEDVSVTSWSADLVDVFLVPLCLAVPPRVFHLVIRHSCVFDSDLVCVCWKPPLDSGLTFSCNKPFA